MKSKMQSFLNSIPSLINEIIRCIKSFKEIISLLFSIAAFIVALSSNCYTSKMFAKATIMPKIEIRCTTREENGTLRIGIIAVNKGNKNAIDTKIHFFLLNRLLQQSNTVSHDQNYDTIINEMIYGIYSYDIGLIEHYDGRFKSDIIFEIAKSKIPLFAESTKINIKVIEKDTFLIFPVKIFCTDTIFNDIIKINLSKKESDGQ